MLSFIMSSRLILSSTRCNKGEDTMTIIEINNKTINVHGHSGYGTRGNDIVCAAISTLVEATYNYLESVGNDLKKEINDGYFKIEYNNLNIPGEEILQSFITMVKDLVSQYPRFIKIEGDII